MTAFNTKWKCEKSALDVRVTQTTQNLVILRPCFAEDGKEMQGRSQGRVPGVLEPPFWVMKIDFISRGKTYRNPPFEILRDEIFVFGRRTKENQFKKASHAISQVTIL